MRLTLKISLVILLGITMLLLFHSYQSFQRETDVLKSSLSREARQIGQVLRAMMVDVWQRQGEKAALFFLLKAGNLAGDQQVRWVWLDDTSEENLMPRVDGKQLGAVRKGETITILAETSEGHDFLFTYIPLRVPGDRIGAIEVGESLAGLHGFVRESMNRSALLLGAIVMSSLLLIAVFGSFWVGRPVKRLAEQAEKMAAGDFSSNLQMRGRDEIAALAAALDRMRGQLAHARKLDRERLEALEKLRHTERLATIGRLSAGMAHELGTPLNVIAGRAKLIAGKELSADETVRSARIIGEQTERMTAIMRQLLNFARRESPKPAPVNLERLAANVLEMLGSVAEKHQATLILEAPESPLEVLADSAQLQQVMLNLVMNGIQALDGAGQVEVSVFTRAEARPPEGVNPGSGPWAVMEVRDTGSGIPSENLPHLFDPFYTTKEVGQGTGLGLSIAYGIVQEHGGWIEVDSTPARGSRFRVWLPLPRQIAEVKDA